MILSKDNLKVSIITVNLNNCQGLYRTINSILKQSFVSSEFIVIDGKSSDGSISAIRKFENQITSWVSEPDKGIYSAMNKGIARAKGEYIVFLNSGDIFASDTVLADIFEDREYAESVLYGEIACAIGKKYYYSKVPEHITLATYFYSTIPHQSAFIKRELFDRFGLYNDDYRIAADLDFWIRTIILSGVTYRKLDCLVSIREADGISDEGFDRNIVPEENLSIYRKHFPAPVVEDYLNWFGSGFGPNRLFINWLLKRRILTRFLRLLYRIDHSFGRKREAKKPPLS